MESGVAKEVGHDLTDVVDMFLAREGIGDHDSDARDAANVWVREGSEHESSGGRGLGRCGWCWCGHVG